MKPSKLKSASAILFGCIGLYVVLNIFSGIITTRITERCSLLNNKSVESPNKDYMVTIEEISCSESGVKTNILLSNKGSPNTGVLVFKRTNQEYIENGFVYMQPPIAVRWNNAYDLEILGNPDNSFNRHTLVLDKVSIRYFDFSTTNLIGNY